MHVRNRFRLALRNALAIRFGSNRITANQFATAYNLITDIPISTETARKWLSGLSLPRYERIYELVHWLNINPHDLFQAYSSHAYLMPSHQLLENKLATELTLQDIEELTRVLRKKPS